MVNGKISRDRLLAQIQAVSFALYDTQLYLDTHPDDRTALEKFDEYNHHRRELTETFSALYGPIDTSFMLTDKGYTWTDSPWPWQEG